MVQLGRKEITPHCTVCNLLKYGERTLRDFWVVILWTQCHLWNISHKYEGSSQFFIVTTHRIFSWLPISHTTLLKYISWTSLLSNWSEVWELPSTLFTGSKSYLSWYFPRKIFQKTFPRPTDSRHILIWTVTLNPNRKENL